MPDQLPLVTLYLSERCNSRCVTCDYWQHGKRDLKLETVEQMLPSLRLLGTRAVLFSGGEPLLNPQWREIAGLLKDNEIDLWLLTSGLSLNKHVQDISQMFESITVSLDGTNAETYLAIRGVNAFRKICEGVRAVVKKGLPVNLRVTLQQANYRELVGFVTLARELGVSQVSFLAVDVSNSFAFARRDNLSSKLALSKEDIAVFDTLITKLEQNHSKDFETGFIAESPAKLRRIRDYFEALLGLRDYPPVRCNAPQFSAVVGADGRVAPCFFIPGPMTAPPAPDLVGAITNESAVTLRNSIRFGERSECKGCVCSMWRDPSTFVEQDFRLTVATDA